jgi:release factor glutamine methyltransferase
MLPSDRTIVWRLSPQTNVGRAINTGAQRLEEAGIDTARLDAQVILAHALGVDRSWLFAHFEHVLTAGQADYFTELIARRIAYEPVAYLVGRKEFYGIELLVDRRVLIPRPETEMLVDAVLDVAAIKAPQPLVVADIGTGSGAIALAVALNTPGARVYALDVSVDALAVAGANTARHDLHGQVTLLHGDLLAPLPAPVDVIVANLPYVTSEDYHHLDQDVRAYEPRLALEAGAQGLDLITRLLAQIPSHLCAGGAVVLEIGYNQGRAILALIERLLPGARDVELSQDYQGHDRMVTFAL